MTLTERIHNPERRQTDLPVLRDRREPLIVRLARERRMPIRFEMREYPRVAA